MECLREALQKDESASFECLMSQVRSRQVRESHQPKIMKKMRSAQMSGLWLPTM